MRKISFPRSQSEVVKCGADFVEILDYSESQSSDSTCTIHTEDWIHEVCRLFRIECFDFSVSFTAACAKNRFSSKTQHFSSSRNISLQSKLWRFFSSSLDPAIEFNLKCHGEFNESREKRKERRRASIKNLIFFLKFKIQQKNLYCIPISRCSSFIGCVFIWIFLHICSLAQFTY